MRAAGLARLTGHAGRHAAVPIGQVKHLAVRRAMDLAKMIVVPRVVRRMHIAAARHRTQVECFGISGSQARQRMFERNRMQLSPGPRLYVVAQQLFGSGHGIRQRRLYQCVTFRTCVRPENRFSGIAKLI